MSDGDVQLLNKASWTVITGFHLLAWYTGSAGAANSLPYVVKPVSALQHAHRPINAPVSSLGQVMMVLVNDLQ